MLLLFNSKIMLKHLTKTNIYEPDQLENNIFDSIEVDSSKKFMVKLKGIMTAGYNRHIDTLSDGVKCINYKYNIEDISKRNNNENKGNSSIKGRPAKSTFNFMVNSELLKNSDNKTIVFKLYRYWEGSSNSIKTLNLNIVDISESL